MGGPAWGPRCEVGRRGGVPRKAREALLPETEASLQGRWQGPRPLGRSLQTTFPSAPSGRSGRHVVAPATPAGAPPQERCARMGGTGLRGQAGLQTRGGSPQDDCVLWGCGSPSARPRRRRPHAGLPQPPPRAAREGCPRPRQGPRTWRGRPTHLLREAWLTQLTCGAWGPRAGNHACQAEGLAPSRKPRERALARREAAPRGCPRGDCAACLRTQNPWLPHARRVLYSGAAVDK